MEFQYTHGVPLRRWDPASTYKYDWPFWQRKDFVNPFDFPSYIAHKGANFEIHLNAEYNTTAFQSWTRHYTIFGQSPFEKTLKHHKNLKHLIHILLRQQKLLTLSLLFHMTSSFSLSISPLLFPPHTPVQLSDNQRSVMKYSHLYLSSQLQQQLTVHQKNADLSPDFKIPVSISSLNSMKLQVDLPQEQNNAEFHQLSCPPSSGKRGQHLH